MSGCFFSSTTQFCSKNLEGLKSTRTKFTYQPLMMWVFIGEKIIRRQHYCLTSAPTWSLRIGWDMAGHTRNWPISKPYSELAARMAVIGCQSKTCSRFLETKALRWTQWLKRVKLSPYYLSFKVCSMNDRDLWMKSRQNTLYVCKAYSIKM